MCEIEIGMGTHWIFNRGKYKRKTKKTGKKSGLFWFRGQLSVAFFHHHVNENAKQIVQNKKPM